MVVVVVVVARALPGQFPRVARAPCAAHREAQGGVKYGRTATDMLLPAPLQGGPTRAGFTVRGMGAEAEVEGEVPEEYCPKVRNEKAKVVELLLPVEVEVG